jgi:hypothetical protein
MLEKRENSQSRGVKPDKEPGCIGSYRLVVILSIQFHADRRDLREAHRRDSLGNYETSIEPGSFPGIKLRLLDITQFNP